jgi:UDP-N-acetylmuramate--alanine ligase
MIHLGRVSSLHLMGIGGAGMCALAEVLLAAGYEVSGCDHEASERTARLARAGAKVTLGHDPAHLAGVDALVVTSAVDRAHPEIVAALGAGVAVVRRSVLLAEILRLRVTVAVAGTHGKTTTTALLGHVLAAADRDPLVVAGGYLKALGGHARAGRGELAVCEADEFDRSFLDLHPVHAIVTNVEPEHLDCYGSEAEVHRAFTDFVGRVPFYGRAVLCADDPGAAALATGLGRRALTYGLGSGATVSAVAVDPGPTGTRCIATKAGVELGPVDLPLAGRHNLANALAVIAMADELGVPFAAVAAALATFPGVARRFDRRGERAGVTVVDDYAHHPTEVAAAIAAARQVFPARRLVVVFQPHLFSRTRDFASAFGTALAAADEVFLLPVYPAREQPLPGVTSELVRAAVAADPRATEVALVADRSAAVAALDACVRSGDVILTLGAGNVDRVAAEWLGRPA